MAYATTSAMTDFVSALLSLSPGSQNGGTYANKPGYHNTRAGNLPTNYSVVDAVDKLGPSDMCAAVDWTFPDAQSGRYATIIKYTNLLLASAKDQQDPRLNYMREFYGQADQDTQVEGWDTRYGRAATSDPSHLWHIHFSFSRATVTDPKAFAAVLSVLRGETTAQWQGEAHDMAKIVLITDSSHGAGAAYGTGGGGRFWLPSWNALQAYAAFWGLSTDGKTFSSMTGAVADYTVGPDVGSPKSDPVSATLVPHKHSIDGVVTLVGTTGEAVANPSV